MRFNGAAIVVRQFAVDVGGDERIESVAATH
jgi:hypothetical protein